MTSRIGLIALIGALLVFAPGAWGQSKRALLIGIDHYTPEHPNSLLAPGHRPDSRFGLGPIAWHNLEGPITDTESMRLLLTQQYGFSDVTVLPEQKATREGIMQAISDHLVRDAAAGDLEVFYFAGHGSQRLNTKSSKADHMDETIVPVDAAQGAFDIRDKELARLFNQALAKKAKLVAIFDSCHSGTQARGLRAGTTRDLPYDDRDVAADPSAYQGEDLDTAPARGNAIILAATRPDRNAEEFPYADTGMTQGVFTRALVATLKNANGAWRAVDVVNSVQAAMLADGWDQQPTLEGDINASLFGDSTGNHALRAAVSSVKDGIKINAGGAAGLAKGSQFTALLAGSDGTKAVLEITSVDSPIESSARLIAPTAEVKPGDLFELSRPAASEAKLLVYVPGLNATGPAANAASAKTQFKTLRWLDDPAQSPRFLVTPNGNGWRANGPGGTTPDTQGASTAFLATPAPGGFIEALQKQQALRQGTMALTDDPLGAQYLLLSRAPAQFSLVNAVVFGTPPAGGYVINPDVACGTDTSMTMRGPWIDGSGPNLDAAAAKLADYADGLAKLRQWSQMTTNSQPARGWPYRLAIMVRSDSGDHELRPGEVLAPGTGYTVGLLRAGDGEVIPKYLYLLGFDCGGARRLLYPDARENGGGPWPPAGSDAPAAYTLFTDDSLDAPYGADTFFLLVSEKKITNLSILGIEATAAEGATSRGLPSAPVLPDWTVQQVVVPSRPKDH